MYETEGASLEITPQVVHLIDLLKRAKEGRLRVPRFQREYVWRRQDIIDLFDSVASQYPIGTLFLWGGQPVPNSRSNIGPLSLPQYNGETWLVLDGQQRLTTLVGVLLLGEEQWTDVDDEDPARWLLFFDAQSNSFVHLSPGEAAPDYCFPVPALLDTVKLFSQLEKLMKSVEIDGAGGGSRDRIFQWVTQAQKVARAIQSYRIPLVEIKTNDLSVAVESFSRLNKKGRSIGQDEMFSALTYGESESNAFHLAAEIDKLQEGMVRSGFGEVDRNILLRAVLTAAGLDMYRTDWTRLGEQVKQNLRGHLPHAIKEAEIGLEYARRFLIELGVLNERMLPYSMQLVALSAFYGKCQNPTASQKQLLTRWFWSSSFTGWFGFGNPARVRRLVDELRDQVSQNPNPTCLDNMDIEHPALSTPLRFDLRSARVRAMLCVCLSRRPLRPDGSELGVAEAARLLFERGPQSMSTLCATVRDADLRKSPANRIIDVTSDASGQAKTWILSLGSDVRNAVLLSHAIPPDSIYLLASGKNDEFLQKRLEFLSSIERDFMAKVGVTPPVSDIPALSPLDADDVDDFKLV
ncbi:DUF262 domain-containing protein [Pseudomonas sp. 148P]|uniref:DUF262 domain-containing protein n=3 Tax=Pseudomonas TaxID=286 RepID=A0ABU7HRU4_9PSED|nr:MULTISPECIES: DUF262 domain-containing protein [unclassified Pseudomonas]MEE1922073.1 DUF262 domain-containing protein [Pseudomonas sp. 147P]MEE1934267.1 DUF262 domain-containing protein [Pseudomonas sp. 148P]